MIFKRIKIKVTAAGTLFLFYKNIIGLPVHYMDAGRLLVRVGTTELVFEEFGLEENSFYHVAFNIPSNKFDEAYRWMKARVRLLRIEDYQSDIAEFTNWNARSFYFEDPVGNILEMIARFDREDVATTPFDATQIRSISEVGIVFPQTTFDDAVADFMQRYSLKYFDKQKPLPHFRAIGDEEGLFITVPENRLWYPTRNKLSKILPVDIQFINGDEDMHYENTLQPTELKLYNND